MGAIPGSNALKVDNLPPQGSLVDLCNEALTLSVVDSRLLSLPKLESDLPVLVGTVCESLENCVVLCVCLSDE